MACHLFNAKANLVICNFTIFWWQNLKWHGHTYHIMHAYDGSCHDANFGITGGTNTSGCHYDNCWCHKWWCQSWQHDNSWFSVTYHPGYFVIFSRNIQATLVDQVSSCRLSFFSVKLKEIKCIKTTINSSYETPFPYITVTSHEDHRVSCYEQFDCLFNSMFRLATKKIQGESSIHPPPPPQLRWPGV